MKNPNEILIDRPLYQNEIRGFIDKPFVKIVVGIRRSGLNSKRTFYRRKKEYEEMNSNK